MLRYWVFTTYKENEKRKLLKKYFIFQANEQVKRSDIANSKSNDLKNNIFSANIEMDNLKKYIEGDRLGKNKTRFIFYISVMLIFFIS